MLRRKLRKALGFKYKLQIPAPNPQFISFTQSPRLPNSLSPILPISQSPNLSFHFINLQKTFKEKPDWNFTEHGMLWAYNLNYFDFLHQEDLAKQEGQNLINDFINFGENHKIGFAPYPTALRIINWVKFLSKYEIKNQRILDSLWAQVKMLEDNPEYHLMGNHLLEDGFGLLFGALFFKNKSLFKKASKLVARELTEQILDDGGHFELSPMYHCTILWRLLDAIHLVEQSDLKEDAFLTFLKEKVVKMLGWIKEVTFENGDIPLVNDSAFKIAPSPKELLDYADKLGLQVEKCRLSDSGYREWQYGNTEILIDVGAIGPDYIPGHAHSDTFNFIMYRNQQPFLVDTGISTYNKNEQRNLERATRSHNTVQIGEHEQSEVWGGFRVGRRARVKILEEQENTIKASHDGYRYLGGSHERTFSLEENKFVIKDKVVTAHQEKIRAFFHFHPDVKPEIKGDKVLTSLGDLYFEGARSMQLAEYFYNEEFNTPRKAMKLVVVFEEELETIIKLL